MSDRPAPPDPAGDSPAPHPVDAVLEALRAVPDALLRPLEPATLYAPPQAGPGWRNDGAAPSPTGAGASA